MAPTVPCKRSPNGITKVATKVEIASEKISKTVRGCIVESSESARQRAESSQSKNHEDHISGKERIYFDVSQNLVHKFIPMPQAMKIPDAKAAVDKEWKKLETIPAWDVGEVKSNKEGILEAQRERKKSPLCYIDGHTSPQECEVGTKSTEVQRQNRAPWWYCKRRFWSLCSVH